MILTADLVLLSRLHPPHPHPPLASDAPPPPPLPPELGVKSDATGGLSDSFNLAVVVHLEALILTVATATQLMDSTLMIVPMTSRIQTILTHGMSVLQVSMFLAAG